MTYKSIGRQRLGKHNPAEELRATIERPLLGNGSINKSCQQQRGCVFCVIHAEGLYRDKERLLSGVIVKE
jgi:hypothetical protein